MLFLVICSLLAWRASKQTQNTDLVVLNQGLQQVAGGVFIPRNGGFEGCIGQSHAYFDHLSGGTMSVVTGEWPRFKSVANLDMVFKVKVAGSETLIEVRQSFDKDPQILFLEEGSDRIGIRVIFKLYDSNHGFHGHGMTETWMHPDGQIFITAASMFENTAAHEAISNASLDIDIPMELRNRNLAVADMTKPNGHLLLTSPDPGAEMPGLSLYWKSGKMEHSTYIYRSSFGLKGAPTYFRWPDYFRQAYTQRTLPDYVNLAAEKSSWPPGKGTFVDKVMVSDQGVKLNWPIDQQKMNPTASFSTLFRLAMVADAQMAKSLVDAEQEPLKILVSDGVIHGNDQGYNDQEGCYEIRKTGSSPVLTHLDALFELK